jgi:DNA-binding transcriptional regulator YiaG
MRLHNVPYTHVSYISQFVVTDDSEHAQANEDGDVCLSYEQGLRYEQRALIAITTKAQSIDGAVLNFARRSLGMKQADFADLLGYSAYQVSRMENGHEKIHQSVQLSLLAALKARYEGGQAAVVELMHKQRCSRNLEISA